MYITKNKGVLKFFIMNIIFNFPYMNIFVANEFLISGISYSVSWALLYFID